MKLLAILFILLATALIVFSTFKAKNVIDDCEAKGGVPMKALNDGILCLKKDALL